MKFTLSGNVDGEPSSVTWEDGLVTASSGLAHANAAMIVAADEPVALTPVGPWIEPSLTDPFAAFTTLLASFDRRGGERVAITGDVPETPEDLRLPGCVDEGVGVAPE